MPKSTLLPAVAQANGLLFIVHVGAEADTIWAYFDPGTGDSSIYVTTAPPPP